MFMNPEDLPNHVKEIFNDKSMSMKKKMMAFMLFATNLPDNPKEDYNDLGRKIKDLVTSGKISLGGFDKHFKLRVTEN